jgi:hypothetical protein
MGESIHNSASCAAADNCLVYIGSAFTRRVPPRRIQSCFMSTTIVVGYHIVSEWVCISP